MAYASVARAKRHKSLARADTTLLTNLLDAATEAVDNYCGRSFASALRTEVYDGNGLTWIVVKHAPITALTSITVTEPDGTTETIASTNFDYDANTGRINFSQDNSSAYDEFPREMQNISVIYTAGYATIPESIQEATVQVAMWLYSQGSTYTNPAYTSERMGEHNYSRIDRTQEMISPLVAALLQKYRRVEFV